MSTAHGPPAGPPPEAYFRVTNPERFRPLHCGCDACGETAAGEGARLEEMLGDVVAGPFSEELTIPLFGDARLGWRLGGAGARDGHYRAAMHVLPRAQARAPRGGGPRIIRWQPWPPRGHWAPPAAARGWAPPADAPPERRR